MEFFFFLEDLHCFLRNDLTHLHSIFLVGLGCYLDCVWGQERVKLSVQLWPGFSPTFPYCSPIPVLSWEEQGLVGLKLLGLVKEKRMNILFASIVKWEKRGEMYPFKINWVWGTLLLFLKRCLFLECRIRGREGEERERLWEKRKSSIFWFFP